MPSYLSCRSARSSLQDCFPNGSWLCRNAKGCNVWVWCPHMGGCQTGSGSFPYQGCQLKYQANVSTSYAPQPLPAAWSRGPPTAFVSGAYCLTPVLM